MVRFKLIHEWKIGNLIFALDFITSDRSDAWYGRVFETVDGKPVKNGCGLNKVAGRDFTTLREAIRFFKNLYPNRKLPSVDLSGVEHGNGVSVAQQIRELDGE